MRSSSSLLLTCAAALLLLTAAGCTEQTPGYCNANTPCAAGMYCDYPHNTCKPRLDKGVVDQLIPDTPQVSDALDVAPKPDGPTSGWSESYATVDGQELNAIWGSSASDIWAVGAAGRIVRYDGSTWSNYPSGTTETLRAIWGSSATDVWIGGESGVLLRHDGKVLTKATSGTTGTINGLWGLSASEIWAATDDKVMHYNGSAWLPQSTSSMEAYCVWGLSSSVAWAGSNGTLLSFNGTAWTAFSPAPAKTNEWIFGVWGAADDDVWAVSDWGGIFHYNGTTWAEAQTLNDLPLNGIWGRSASDIWACGAEGRVMHYDGKQWQVSSTGRPGELQAIWSASATDVWALELQMPTTDGGAKQTAAILRLK